MLMAHAARRTLVTVERVEDRDFLADEGDGRRHYSGALLSRRWHRCRTEPGRSGWQEPIRPTSGALAAYAAAARDDADFARWLEGVRTPEPA